MSTLHLTVKKHPDERWDDIEVTFGVETARIRVKSTSPKALRYIITAPESVKIWAKSPE